MAGLQQRAAQLREKKTLKSKDATHNSDDVRVLTDNCGSQRKPFSVLGIYEFVISRIAGATKAGHASAAVPSVTAARCPWIAAATHPLSSAATRLTSDRQNVNYWSRSLIKSCVYDVGGVQDEHYIGSLIQHNTGQRRQNAVIRPICGFLTHSGRRKKQSKSSTLLHNIA